MQRKVTLAIITVVLALTSLLGGTYPVAAQGGDDRVNPFGGLGAPVAIYFQDGAITVYVITPQSEGEYLFTISAEAIEEAGVPEVDTIVLWEDVNPYGGFDIIVSRLATGEFRLDTRKDAAFNPPDDTEPYIVVWLTDRSDAYTLKY